MTKLKTTQVKPYREETLKKQNYCCQLCKLPITEKAVLDHDHKTGAIRAVLHDSCNRLLGKIETNHKRFCVIDLRAFLEGVYDYLKYHEQDRTQVLHPTHKTPEEKKALAKARRKRRQAKDIE